MNADRLLNTFLELVRLDNPSKQETAVVHYLCQALEALGLEVEQDAVLNLVTRLPGSGEPVLLNAHTDSVQSCLNVTPIVVNGIVRSSGDTVLGADDLAGVAAILEGVRSTIEAGSEHRAAEILFTSQEEIGLKGASAFDYRRLNAQYGFAFDAAGEVGGICLGAPSQDNLYVAITGKAAHAGLEPERGISAIRVAAEAIISIPLGRIDAETTANIGVIRGGEATNIVPPRLELWGEARSHNPDSLDTQVAAMSNAFSEAAARHNAQAEVTITRCYEAYRLTENEPVVQQAQAAIRAIGLQPRTFVSGGGSDINIFCQNGLRVANLSVGYHDIHSNNEYIAVADLERVAQLVETLLRI